MGGGHLNSAARVIDFGFFEFTEPFRRLKSQGMVLMDGAAMSKSRGNLVAPSAVIDEFGADTLRATMLFAGPIEDDIDWADVSPEGTYRWLARVWRLTLEHVADGPTGSSEPEASLKLRKATHRAIAGASEDYAAFKFNTAIAKLMELTNAVQEARRAGVRGQPVHEALEALVQMLAPVGCFIAEELWRRLGHAESVHATTWPSYEPSLLIEEEVAVVVQVDGKVRDRITVPRDAGEATVRAVAESRPNVARHVRDRHVVKVVFVPDRLVNFVTRPA